MSNTPYTPPKSKYIPAISTDGRLLFKFDPTRGIIEVSLRGFVYHVDLATLDSTYQNNRATLEAVRLVDRR